MRPYQVINFIVGRSKKVLFSYVFKSEMVVAREMYNSYNLSSHNNYIITLLFLYHQ